MALYIFVTKNHDKPFTCYHSNSMNEADNDNRTRSSTTISDYGLYIFSFTTLLCAKLIWMLNYIIYLCMPKDFTTSEGEIEEDDDIEPDDDMRDIGTEDGDSDKASDATQHQLSSLSLEVQP